MADTYRAAWEDLADRIDRALDTLEAEAQRSDRRGADRDPLRASTLREKRRGVALVKDYMRGYGLPTRRYEPKEETPNA